mmetsp:Transcript_33483/g.61508  ORF Transcript_33483/g.61508 Transcript_33483/m.61508 type:complete len:150 (+) Transcript_33483:61-510(+)|eukprot:CAMPEP_0201608920 /NCGR_PEP_ID=MMETSP0492-20130828/9458_1 /ASSEMBLY_ACC=CAM_ASM_000837 /TAXON_ID=420259 /ORGANISM="Thalassiosira gravida, Strain GMp14c1" /LENGTH=149 /DNA_ID=CAMNT_0048073977 /DNA_START=722 /DNA_END=1171 /DNA_ORIENTATION=-
MFAARAASRTTAMAARRTSAATTTTAKRSNQTVPRLAPLEEMKAEAIAQLRARVRRQKEIADATGHSEAEELAEMWKWIKISFAVATPVCVLSVVKDLTLIDHAHRPHGPLPDYMAIQTKEFPWECETCALFDLECWKKCREEQAAESA